MKKLNGATFSRSDDSYTVHMLTSPAETFMSNAYLIESNNAVVAIDTLMLVSEAEAMRAYIDKIAKPLVAVFITHAHPDHYNGTATLLNGLGDVPVISTEGVSQCIAKVITAKDTKWRPHFGDDWPRDILLPTRIVTDNSVLTFDGINYSVHELGPAESDSDLYIIVGNKKPVVFVGDVVFNQVHSFMNDGHSLLWLKSLDRLSSELKDIELLFTGHGQPGASLEVIEAQKNYLITYRRELSNLLASETQLTSLELKNSIEEKLSALFPNYDMIGFIAAGANAVAAEIISARLDSKTL